jgi:hypothetical protein
VKTPPKTRRKAGQTPPDRFAFTLFKASALRLHQSNGDVHSKAKPSEGTPQGPVDRGFAADYFGASPVASALNLPRERDFPENRNQTIKHSPPNGSKQDISTLQGIGHFYFALTENSPWCRRKVIMSYLRKVEMSY